MDCPVFPKKRPLLKEEQPHCVTHTNGVGFLIYRAPGCPRTMCMYVVCTYCTCMLSNSMIFAVYGVQCTKWSHECPITTQANARELNRAYMIVIVPMYSQSQERNRYSHLCD